MTKWEQHRQALLAIAFAGILFTIGRFSLDATAGNRSVKAFVFPSVVPLPGWQLLDSRSLALPIVGSANYYDVVSASRRYHYRQHNQQMEIEMRYVVGTLGEFPGGYLKNSNLTDLHSSQILHNIRYQQGVGFYTLFTYQGRLHLSTCINSQGGSTVTVTQFLQNRHTYDLDLPHLVAWLLGKESLFDRRCLWTHLSMPLHQVSAATTYPVLEQAWLSWYHWWRVRFPQY